MNNAKLIGLDEAIEEEVTLEVNGVKFTGFSSVCPYNIIIGNSYLVEVYLTFLGSENFVEIKNEEYSLSQLNRSYAYLLRGQVHDNYIDVGHDVQFNSNGLFSDYPYLSGKFVEVAVDRLDVEFL